MFKKITLIAAAAMLLAACDKKPETIAVDFVELEKTDDLHGVRAVYVSHVEREYYATYLSAYEYNHFEKLGIDKSLEITLKSFTQQINSTDMSDYRYVDSSGNEYDFESVQYYEEDSE